MIVKLFDDRELIVSKNAADRLKMAIERSTEGFVNIHGELVNKKAIAGIRNGGETLVTADHRIAPHDYRGEESPGKEKVRQMLKDKGLIK